MASTPRGSKEACVCCILPRLTTGLEWHFITCDTFCGLYVIKSVIFIALRLMGLLNNLGFSVYVEFMQVPRFEWPWRGFIASLLSMINDFSLEKSSHLFCRDGSFWRLYYFFSDYVSVSNYDVIVWTVTVLAVDKEWSSLGGCIDYQVCLPALWTQVFFFSVNKPFYSYRGKSPW